MIEIKWQGNKRFYKRFGYGVIIFIAVSLIFWLTWDKAAYAKPTYFVMCVFVLIGGYQDHKDEFIALVYSKLSDNFRRRIIFKKEQIVLDFSDKDKKIISLSDVVAIETRCALGLFEKQLKLELKMKDDTTTTIDVSNFSKYPLKTWIRIVKFYQSKVKVVNQYHEELVGKFEVDMSTQPFSRTKLK
jgi:hypothetical protein